MWGRPALVMMLLAPALVRAAHGAQAEAHRRHVAHVHDFEERQVLRPILGGGNGTSSSTEDEPTSTPPLPTSSDDDDVTSATPTRSTPSIGPSSPTASSGSMSQTGTASLSSGSALSTTSGLSQSGSTSSSTSSSTSQSTAQSSTSQSSMMAETTALTTDAAGQTVTRVITVPVSQSSAPSTSDSSSAANNNNNDKKDEGSGISTGAIIGIAVGVGAVVFGLIGMAIWRMKRRGGDEDEAIRWPELNRHGDSDAHHALPARQTGQHGIETSPLERSLTNGSDMYMPAHSASTHQHHHMALGGSNFGAASSLSHEPYDEKDLPNPHGDASMAAPIAGYDAYEQYYAQQTHPSALQPHAGAGHLAYDAYGNPADNYASFPPQVGMQVGPGQGGPGMAYDSDSEGHAPMGQVGGAVSYGHGMGHGQR